MMPSMIEVFDGESPSIPRDAFVAPGAVVIGDVSLGEGASVWYGCVIRGDVSRIEIGPRTNIQDSSIIHVGWETPTIVGSEVTVGHGAILHACRIGDLSLIGMGAIILDGAEIGVECLVAAGSVVPPGMKLPERSFVAGVPARFRRKVTDAEAASFRESAARYIELARRHAR